MLQLVNGENTHDSKVTMLKNPRHQAQIKPMMDVQILIIFDTCTYAKMKTLRFMKSALL